MPHKDIPEGAPPDAGGVGAAAGQGRLTDHVIVSIDASSLKPLVCVDDGRTGEA